MSISQHHGQCMQKLQLLSELLAATVNTLERDDPDMNDELDRYILWSGNVGAHHSGDNYSISLDYRLREAPFYRDQVLKLLGLLERHIDKAITLIQGVSPYFDEESDSEAAFSSHNVHYELGETVKHDDDSWNIDSDADSKASLADPPGKSQTGTTSPDANAAQPHRPVLRSIRYTMDCLYQLPLRGPAPITRIREGSANELGFYEHFDVLYVKDKFPMLQESIAFRLGRMITKRRELLLYRKRHRDKLQPAPGTRASSIEKSIPKSNPSKTKVDRQEEGTPTSHVIDTGARSQITLPSKATTLRMKDVAEQSIEIPESRPATSIAASEKTQHLRLCIPPRPRSKAPKGPGRAMFFECNYCRLLPTITSDLAWKRHVLSDLQPFICTFEECDRPYHFFSSRDAWFEHETQQHRLEYFCNAPDHRAFHDLNDFTKHMHKHHEFPSGMMNFEVLLQAFRRPSHSTEGICNLCMKSTRKLQLHVSRHLEQLALFAIPRADYAADDEDEDNDSNVSQKNVEGSRDEILSIHVSDDDSPATSEKDGEVEAEDTGFELEPVRSDFLGVDYDVPDTDAVSWDTITNKFQEARLDQGVRLVRPSAHQDYTDAELFDRNLFRKITRPIDVLREWEGRYNERPVSNEEFFKPPELREIAPTVRQVDPNADADVFFRVPNDPPSRATTMPGVNVTVPTPPGSPRSSKDFGV